MFQVSAKRLLRSFKCGLVAGSIILIPCLAGSAHAGTTVFKYDAQDRLIEVDYANGSKILYTYDSAGNCTSIVKST
jgi:YD repeat-containing protein